MVGNGSLGSGFWPVKRKPRIYTESEMSMAPLSLASAESWHNTLPVPVKSHPSMLTASEMSIHIVELSDL